MERFKKETREFFKDLRESDEVVKDQQEVSSVRNIVRAARMIQHPENLPKALIAYGITKQASVKITEEIHPLKLRDFLLDNYGTEWIDWLSENLDWHLLRDQKNDIISNKAQALRVCLGTDTPWREWHIFENVGQAFNNDVPNFGMLQPLTIGECEVTMRTMQDLRQEEVFEEEVLIYVAVSAFTKNLVYLPIEWQVSKAQPYLDTMIHDVGLKINVRDSWDVIKDLDLMDKKFDQDNATQRQLADLAVIQQYIRENDVSYNGSTSE